MRAAGATDAGRQRDVNEDRFHVDVNRGLFVVVDGVGGQAAGGKAADVAMAMLRERLERETGPVADRLREAIAIANNEIYRLASSRPEWSGMGCVVTAAVVHDDVVTVGHVGDTRLYKLRHGHIEKITRDHSPVGEREDARELSEQEAMRHPRRHEVYRDVGADPHSPNDADFVDVEEVAFERDAALLLCSDGLTDQVDSATIAAVVRGSAGDPAAIVRRLVEAANAAGGKDNVTVVYVEGDRFAAALRSAPSLPSAGIPARGDSEAGATRRTRRWPARVATVVFLLLVAAAVLNRTWLLAVLQSSALVPRPLGADVHIVQPNESIGEAIARAAPGTEVVVEPGEYREQLTLKDGVRVVSRVPRAARLRLPAAAPDGPAVIANGVVDAAIAGFTIVGDAATPLGVGIHANDSTLSIVDVAISGASRAGLEFSGGRTATLLASEIHDNPGAALIVRSGASPRIAHNAFARNGRSEPSAGAFLIEAGAAPAFRGNVFVGVDADALAGGVTATAAGENWFVPIPPPAPSGAPAVPRKPR